MVTVSYDEENDIIHYDELRKSMPDHEYMKHRERLFELHCYMDVCDGYTDFSMEWFMTHPKQVVSYLLQQGLARQELLSNIINTCTSLCKLYDVEPDFKHENLNHFNMYMFYIRYYFAEWKIIAEAPDLDYTLEPSYPKHELVVVRGIPGSGKTTYAKNTFPQYVYVDTDMFFTDKEGKYKYNPLKASEAHSWCRNQAFLHLSKGKSVVVANTFAKEKDVEWFRPPKNVCPNFRVLRMALDKVYANKHNVPLSKVESILARFEDVPGETFVSMPLVRKGVKTIQDIMVTDFNCDVGAGRYISVPEQRNEFLPLLQASHKKSLMHHFKYLACVLYSCMPPLRDQWANMYVCDAPKEQRKAPSSTNVLYLSKLNEDIEINLQPYLGDPGLRFKIGFLVNSRQPDMANIELVTKVLKESFKLFPRDWVFCDLMDRTKCMGQNQFREFINKIYDDFGRGFGIDMAIKAYTGHVNIQTLSNNEINSIAKIMRVDQEPLLFIFYRVLSSKK